MFDYKEDWQKECRGRHIYFPIIAVSQDKTCDERGNNPSNVYARQKYSSYLSRLAVGRNIFQKQIYYKSNNRDRDKTGNEKKYEEGGRF